MTVKSSIPLSDEQLAFARKLVEEGRFDSIGDVVGLSLDLLRQHLAGDGGVPERLKALLLRRREGAFVEAEEFDHRLDVMIAAKRRANGVSA